MWYKNIAGRFFGLVTKHACDRQTDGQLLQAEISPVQRFVKVVRHFDAIFEVEGLVFPPISVYR